MEQQITVEQVVMLLKKGIDPQELMQYGVPEEMIQQAMQVLQQEMNAPQEGLAQRFVGEADSAMPMRGQ